jgi:hypothetical protein
VDLKQKTKRNQYGCLHFFACEVRFSYFKNTIFENYKLSILTTIKYLDIWLEGVPQILISNITSVNVTTVKNIYKKIRDFDIFSFYLATFKKIGGDNKIIEINESKFVKRKYNRGHRVEGV